MRTQAYRTALAGAQAAAAVSSRREAFELYRRAVANVPDGLEPAELAALYQGYLGAAHDVDDVAVASEVAPLVRRYHLEAGMALEAATDLVTQAAAARRDLVGMDHKRRLLHQAQAELAALPPSPDRAAGEADILSMLGAFEVEAGRLDAAEEHLREARRLALVSSEPDTTGVDYLLAEVDILLGDVRPAFGRMLDLARNARAARNETAGVGVYRWAAVSAVRMMEHETAHLGVEEGLRYAAEIEQSYCRHSLASAAAQLAWAEGRWDDAVDSARIEVVEPGSARGRLGSRDSLGLVAMGRGEVADARALLEPSLGVLRESGEVGLYLGTLWGLAETDLVAGEPEAAFARCEEAMSLTAESGLRPMLVQFVVTGARSALAARRPVDAERWLERVTDRLQGWEAMAGPALDHASGLVRLATGSTGAARAALAAAVTGWDARGRTWEATWARLDLASCLVRMNRHADAVPLLREVETTADRLGSIPLRDRARTMLQRARSRTTVEEPWRPLTVREFEVARLVARGWTNNEIAEELSLAPRTVNAHLEHILGKLGVGRRAEVATWVSGIDGAPAAAGAGPEAVAARR